jgi:hypothetical protein
MLFFPFLAFPCLGWVVVVDLSNEVWGVGAEKELKKNCHAHAHAHVKSDDESSLDVHTSQFDRRFAFCSLLSLFFFFLVVVVVVDVVVVVVVVRLSASSVVLYQIKWL